MKRTKQINEVEEKRRVKIRKATKSLGITSKKKEIIMIKRTEIGALEKNMLQMIKNFGNRKANNQKKHSVGNYKFFMNGSETAKILNIS